MRIFRPCTLFGAAVMLAIATPWRNVGHGNEQAVAEVLGMRDGGDPKN
jgi:hypothetical protein